MFQPIAIGATPPSAGTPGALKEARYYDVLGRLIEQNTFYGTGETKNNIAIAGWRKHTERYEYNVDGQVIRQVTRGRVLNWTAVNYDLAYAASDAALTDLSVVQTSFDKLGRSSGYTYQYLRHAEDYTGEAGDAINFTHTYGIKYQGRDGYLEKQVWGHSTTTNFRASTSESVYDGWGRRIAIREHTPLPKSIGTIQDRVRYFSYDAEGMILRRREGVINSSGNFEQSAEALKKDELYAYANGQQVAKQTRGGNLELRTKLAAYQEAGRTKSSKEGLKLGVRDFIAGAMGKYGSVTGRADQLEDAVTRLTDYSTGALGMSSVPVNSGDTLQSIAQRVYGNSGLWYVLAEANAISNAELVPGTSLRVPSVRVNSNDANTFKPYNPGEIVGTTSPGMPYIEPPAEAGGGCKQVIGIIIATVIRVVTQVIGAALVQTGMFAWLGVLIGAAGELVAQGVEMAVDLRDKISWGAVAVAAVSTLVMGKIQAANAAKAAQAAKFTKTATQTAQVAATATTTAGQVVKSALSSLGTSALTVSQSMLVAAGNYGANYLIMKATGEDASFSWKGLAASVATAYIGAKMGNRGLSTAGVQGTGSVVGNAVANTSFSWGHVAWAAVKQAVQDTPRNLAVAAVNKLVTQAITGKQQDWNPAHLLADGFGNALGSAIVDGISGRLQQRMAVEEAREAQRTAVPKMATTQDIQAAAETFALGPDAEPASVQQLPEDELGATMPRTVIVARGQSLFTIAEEQYGDGNLWPILAQANNIKSPDLIRAGAELSVPSLADYDQGAVTDVAGDFYRAKQRAAEEQARHAAQLSKAADLAILDRWNAYFRLTDVEESVRLQAIASSRSGNIAKARVQDSLAKSILAHSLTSTDLAASFEAASLYMATLENISENGATRIERLNFPEASRAAEEWAGLSKSFKLFGLGIGIAGDGYEYWTMDKSSSADWGHLGVSATITGLSLLPRLTPIGVGWSVLDTGVSYNSHLVQYGENAGSLVTGWSSLYYEGRDHHETQIHEIMTTYKLSRTEAQNFWFSTHVK